MKRILTIAVLLTVFVSVASASWWSWQVKPFGNAAGNTVRGQAADTLIWTTYVGTGGFRNVENMMIRVRADSVVDSIPAMTINMRYKPDYLFGVATWVTVGVKADSSKPLDGSIVYTLHPDTVAAFFPKFTAFNACSLQFIMLGIRADQVAKSCSLGVYLKK